MSKYERLMPRRSERWSKEDDALVQKAFLDGGYPACFTAFPNRSKVAIQKRIRKAGLAKRNCWTEEADCFLSGSWGFISIDRIAKKLGRTTAAVQQRVTRLGLSSMKSEDGKESELLESSAHRIGYHKPTLLRILKFSNVIIHRILSRSNRCKGELRRLYVYKEEVDAAVARWQSTEMVKPAARARKVSAPLLIELLKDSGKLNEETMKIGRTWRVPTDLIDQVLKEWKQKETLESASYRIGVTPNTLKSWLKMSGVNLSPGKNHFDPLDVNSAVQAYLDKTAGQRRKFTIKDIGAVA